MPIPGLSAKIKSPQQWRKSRYGHDNGSSFFNSRLRKNPDKKSGFNFKKALKIIGGVAIFGIIAMGLFGLGLIAWVSKDLPNPNQIVDRVVPLSTKIYDRTGEQILYEIHGIQNRTMIELEDIPKYATEATLAAEDRKFYEHKGISLTGIIRSAFKNVFTGSRVGGSTLTQQLVKNAILTPEKKYIRKIKELILSYQIEKRFSKDEILKMYFNEIPYGSTAYGIEAAAQAYFGKSAKDINLAEASILASLPQAPSFLSPYGGNKDRLLARQHWILDSMVELGYISNEKAAEAKNEELQFRKLTKDIIAPHFVMYIKEYLSGKYGEKTVEQGGLKVITTLDSVKQKLAEETIREIAEKNLNYNASNAALVAIDTKTGQILTMVGSKDFFNEEIDGQVNVATRPRQPGSSFKPIVYAAAFKKGYTPNTVLFDINTQFVNYDGNIYEPKNYNLKEHGAVTIRQALAGSLNIPAVKTIYLTGMSNVLDLADSMGYKTLQERKRFGLSLVLGGGEVKLLEHTNAFAVFAREGEKREITGILRVEDKDGNLLEEFKNQETKVLETEVARQINDILSDNSARAFAFGENNSLTLGDRPVAAKTGTTNDFRDAWTVGYTPSVAVGVWVGNNDSSQMKPGADGSIVAAPIWRSFVSKILTGTPVESFKKPTEIITGNPVLDGDIKEGVILEIDRISGKLATEYTPPEYIEEKKFQNAHCILYYINKDDPRGGKPDKPENDPQFKYWEEAVQKWLAGQEIVMEEIPTETDDVHLPQYQPRLEILYPKNNDKITSRDFSVNISVDAVRGVDKVDYFLNKQLVKSERDFPFNLNVKINDPNIENGFAQLKVIAYDDVGNRTEKNIDLNLMLPEMQMSVNMISPNNNQIFSQESFPVNIVFNIIDRDTVAKIIVYYQEESGKINFINTIRQFNNDQVGIPWATYPNPGIYFLYAEITNNDGYTYLSKKVLVEVK